MVWRVESMPCFDGLTVLSKGRTKDQETCRSLASRKSGPPPNRVNISQFDNDCFQWNLQEEHVSFTNLDQVSGYVDLSPKMRN
jgi:hypothetical protein